MPPYSRDLLVGDIIKPDAGEIAIEPGSPWSTTTQVYSNLTAHKHIALMTNLHNVLHITITVSLYPPLNMSSYASTCTSMIHAASYKCNYIMCHREL